MYSELEGTEKALYLNNLKKSPDYKIFLNYERCKEYLTKISMIKVSKALTNFIQSTKYDKISRILPILTSINVDKGEIFDITRSKIQEGRLIYVPPPPEFVGIFYHVYNCIIEELGLIGLEEITKSIQTQYIRKTRLINALINYFCDKEKEEQSILDFENKIKPVENSLELIQLITNFSNEVILLYFEDIESPSEIYGENAEIKLLESIKRLHYDVKQLVIILTCPRSSWLKISNLGGESFSSILGPEVEFYDISQLRTFVIKAMEEYWVKNGVTPPKNPYFPLNENLVNLFYEKTKGDIKSFLKLYLETIRKIILGEILE